MSDDLARIIAADALAEQAKPEPEPEPERERAYGPLDTPRRLANLERAVAMMAEASPLTAWARWWRDRLP